MEFSINIKSVQDTSNQFQNIKYQMGNDSFKMEDIVRDLRRTDDTALHVFSAKLEIQAQQVRRKMRKLDSMQKGLDRITHIYNDTEEKIASEEFTSKGKRKWKLILIPVDPAIFEKYINVNVVY